MKLKWLSDKVTRSNVDGKKVETVEQSEFEVLADNGQVIGNARVDMNNASMNISLYGHGNVEDGVALLKETVGIVDPEDPEEE